MGRPPLLTDSELVCVAVAQAMLGFTSEAHWLPYARKHLRGLFPYLPQQSGYNKRLQPRVEARVTGAVAEPAHPARSERFHHPTRDQALQEESLGRPLIGP